MGQRPFFSVVLPTLNRAEYLHGAIESVLQQSFEDFELIVSDNSSIDNTRDVVTQFLDPRVRYTKTPRRLSIGDSWEYALDQASGEYITFLGDDDAHGRIYLESLKKIIDEHDADVVSCKTGEYYHQEVFENGKLVGPNSFVTTSFTNQLAIHEPREVIEYLFVSHGLCRGSVSEQFQTPHLINTAYHRSIFTKIRNRFGRVFPEVLSGDFYLAVLVLNIVGKYFHLDSPLSFHGVLNVSTTSSINSVGNGLSLTQTQPELARFKRVPIKLLVPYNFSSDALLLAKSNLGQDLDYLSLDLTEYFVRMYQHLHALELSGKDISSETKEFVAALQQQDSIVQQRFKAVSLNTSNVIKNKIRLKVYPTRLYKYFSTLRRKDERIYINGDGNNFANIAEFAERVETHLLSNVTQPISRSRP